MKKFKKFVNANIAQIFKKPKNYLFTQKLKIQTKFQYNILNQIRVFKNAYNNVNINLPNGKFG